MDRSLHQAYGALRQLGASATLVEGKELVPESPATCDFELRAQKHVELLSRASSRGTRSAEQRAGFFEIVICVTAWFSRSSSRVTLAVFRAAPAA